jgi:hypothetical protein
MPLRLPQTSGRWHCESLKSAEVATVAANECAPPGRRWSRSGTA